MPPIATVSVLQVTKSIIDTWRGQTGKLSKWPAGKGGGCKTGCTPETRASSVLSGGAAGRACRRWRGRHRRNARRRRKRGVVVAAERRHRWPNTGTVVCYTCYLCVYMLKTINLMSTCKCVCVCVPSFGHSGHSSSAMRLACPAAGRPYCCLHPLGPCDVVT